MTTGRINQVNINSSFVPRISKNTSTSKKTMQTEVYIVFLQEILEIQTNIIDNLSMNPLSFICLTIFFTEIVS